MKKNTLLLLMTWILSSVSLNSKSEELVDAKALRHNVVAIQAKWENKTHNGFGWIVGVNDNKAYIVTANHIVRGKRKSAIDRSPTVTLYLEKQRITEAVKLLPQNDRALDLAILEMPLPNKLLVKYSVADFSPPTKSNRVTYIGAATRWEVPSNPEGIITNVNEIQLLVKGLNVDVGTSGAPLIGKNGILGMFISNGATSNSETFINTANVLTISTIKQKVEEWQYPWSLDSFVSPSHISGNWHYLFPGDEPIHVSVSAYIETPHHFSFIAKLVSNDQVASGIGVVDGSMFRVVYKSVLVPSDLKAELLVKVAQPVNDQSEAVLMEGIVSFVNEFGEPTTEIMRLVKLKKNGDYYPDANAYMKENPHPELDDILEGEAIAKQISKEYIKKTPKPQPSKTQKHQSLDTTGTPELPASSPQVSAMLIHQMQTLLKMANITEVSLSLKNNCITAEGQIEDEQLFEKIGSVLHAMSAQVGIHACNNVKLTGQ